MFTGIRNWFRKVPEKKQRPNHDFDDEDRLHAVEIRRMNHAIKMKQKELELKEKEAELDNLLDQIGEYDEEEPEVNLNNPDAMFMNLLSQLLTKQSNPQTPQNSGGTAQPPEPSSSQLTDEQIKQFIKEQPAHIEKQIHAYTDKEIQTFLRSYYPELNEATIAQVIKVART